MDGTHLIIPRGPKNVIVYREERIAPFIENLPQSSVNYLDEDLGTYSIFCEDESNSSPPLDIIPKTDNFWSLYFDGAASQDGNGAGVYLHDNFSHTHVFSFRLNFRCTNNIAEFEALILGLNIARQMGLRKIHVYGDSELVVNYLRKNTFHLKNI